MLYNFVADSFKIKKLYSRLSESEVRFYTENGVAFFEPPLGVERQRMIFSLGSFESA